MGRRREERCGRAQRTRPADERHILVFSPRRSPPSPDGWASPHEIMEARSRFPMERSSPLGRENAQTIEVRSVCFGRIGHSYKAFRSMPLPRRPCDLPEAALWEMTAVKSELQEGNDRRSSLRRSSGSELEAVHLLGQPRAVAGESRAIRRSPILTAR